MPRKRSPAAIGKKREWRQRHAAYLARGRANIPPQPDPHSHPREFAAWMRENARRGGFTAEEKQLFADMKALPKSKRSGAEADRWDMIYCLLLCQERQRRPLLVREIDDYDLEARVKDARAKDGYSYVYKLGRYPGPGTNGKGSKQLQNLLAILKACDQPDITPVQLYDSIRDWRKRRLEEAPPRTP